MFRRILSFLLFQAPFFLHSEMKMLDLIILLPLIYGAYKGYKRGFIMSLFMLLAVIVGLYAAFHFTDVIVSYGQEHFKWTSKYISQFVFSGRSGCLFWWKSIGKCHQVSKIVGLE